jgi:hypothetical protein
MEEKIARKVGSGVKMALTKEHCQLILMLV